MNPPPNENTTTGDTFWADGDPRVFQGLLTKNPEIRDTRTSTRTG